MIRSGQNTARCKIAGLTLWFAAWSLTLVALLRSFGADAHPLMVAAVGLTPWLLAPAWLLLLVAAAQRRLYLVALALALSTGHLLWSLDDWSPGGRDPLPRSDVRVAIGNISVENDEPDAFVAAMVGTGAQIILVQELTPDAWTAIDSLTILDNYGHRVLDPQTTGLGSAILSSMNLESGAAERFGVGWRTLAVLPLGVQEITIFNLHLTTPDSSLGIERWRDEHDLLADEVMSSETPLVLAGDFNSSGQHDEFRGLLGAGLTDAHDAAGRGFGFTWAYFGLPVMRLDHVVVTDELQVNASTVVAGPGSDHDILVVDLSLR